MLSKNKSLVSLSIRNVPSIAKLVPFIAKIGSLRHLDLSNNAIDDAGFKHLIAHLGLRSLHLQDSKIVGGHYDILLPLQKSPLHTLDLSGNPVHGDMLRVLANHTSLTTLLLNNIACETWPSDKGHSTTTALPLSRLSIAHNKIKGKHFEEINRYKSLTKLDLSLNPLNDDAHESLLTLKTLTSLNLAGTQIATRSAVAINLLPNLIELNISMTLIQKSFVNVLKNNEKRSVMTASKEHNKDEPSGYIVRFDLSMPSQPSVALFEPFTRDDQPKWVSRGAEQNGWTMPTISADTRSAFGNAL